MDQDVVADRRRHQDEPPIEGNVAVPSAGSPPGPLIADAHCGHRHAVLGGEFEQPGRQLGASALAEGSPLLGANRWRRQLRALALDPLGMTLEERIRFTLRTTARNRHAHATVMFDAKQIPPGATVANEIDGGVRAVGCRCDRTIAGRCKIPYAGRCNGTFACRCEAPSDCRCARVVSERQVELHERQNTRSVASPAPARSLDRTGSRRRIAPASVGRCTCY